MPLCHQFIKHSSELISDELHPDSCVSFPRSDNDRQLTLLLLQVVTGEEVEAMQAAGELLFCEQACGYLYGVTKAAVQAVQYQDKVSLLHG